ncbi:hypothetical protein IEQ34_016021 [Dendrobium chrysotoxum]|uniref:Maturase K n=1 Tax=Dendrobium chrysotoxum TaxID=161865 RepID=A0AAV7GEX6_DENCH|nr:hypothetical protein IEQ34_016021 [Dendrobium chrysotoxum]
MVVNRFKDPGFLNGVPKSCNFLDALSKASAPMSFPNLKNSPYLCLPSLWISEEEIFSLATPFEFALVEQFTTRRSPLDSIQKIFFQLKLIDGHFSVTILNPKHLLIKLVNNLDYNRVFSHLSFPNLCPYLFSPRIHHGLGSLFDRLLKIDNVTSIGSLVLVEHDITKRYPDRVWLGPKKLGYIQHIEMEAFSSLCGHYKSLVHSRVE